MNSYTYLYIIGTVNIRTVSYRMVTRLPKGLKSNEFAYKLELVCNLDSWKNRVLDVKLPVISPPEENRLAVGETILGKSLSERAIDRMSG